MSPGEQLQRDARSSMRMAPGRHELVRATSSILKRRVSGPGHRRGYLELTAEVGHCRQAASKGFD